MELQSVTLEGFRKFEVKTELKTNGKLVALLGPNEAGKTSVLRAISQIGTREKIPDSDLSREKDISDKQAVIIAKFRLSSEDLEAANIPNNTWFYLSKTKSGGWIYKFEPNIPPRDISIRKRIAKDLERIKSNNKIWGPIYLCDPLTWVR